MVILVFSFLVMQLAGPCRSPQLQKDTVVPSMGGMEHWYAHGSHGKEGVQPNKVLGGVWEQGRRRVSLLP